MVNGNRTTWEEDTKAMLREAKEKLKNTENEAVYWRNYVEALNRILDLRDKNPSIKVKEEYPFDSEKLLKQSVKDSLIDIATARNGLLIVTEAVPILVNAGVFSDRDQARNSIYSNLSHNKRKFRKERPGIYRFYPINKEIPLPVNT